MDILTTLPLDTFVTAAFAELLEDVGNLLSVADGRDERTFWRRQLTALNKAQYHWLAGVRPQLTGDAYLLPSASSSGLMVYRLIKQGGILVCDCKAGQNGILCWHHMAINVIERAAELESRDVIEAEISGSGNDPECGPNPIPHAHEAAAWVGGHIALQQRLAATAQLLDTLRAAQGRTALATNDEPRRLGMRLMQARRRSAAFASAFYLEAA
jgi:hypothetical protein